MNSKNSKRTKLVSSLSASSLLSFPPADVSFSFSLLSFCSSGCSSSCVSMFDSKKNVYNRFQLKVKQKVRQTKVNHAYCSNNSLSTSHHVLGFLPVNHFTVRRPLFHFIFLQFKRIVRVCFVKPTKSTVHVVDVAKMFVIG